MLIKKNFGTYRLYTHILVSFVVAAIISILCWNITTYIADFTISKRYDELNNSYKKNFDNYIKDMQNIIDASGLSKVDTLNILNNKNMNIEYDIFIIDAKGDLVVPTNVFKSDIDDIPKQGLYIYQAKFNDGDGFIIIRPEFEDAIIYFYKSFAFIISLVMFILITLGLVGGQLKYIEEINSVTAIIAGGSIHHNIPEKGNNELTHLAKSINDMKNSLNTLLKEERIADAKQRRLITNLSHDLRTPLTTIIGYLTILKDGKYNNQDEANEYLEATRLKSLRLEKLINNLFTYTRIINGDISQNFSDVDINLYVFQYIELQTLEINYKSSCNNCIIYGDIDWLNRIFDNLFSNIYKYAVPKTNIDISLFTIDSSVFVSIENFSIQNLNDKVEFLFDRMYIGDEDRNDNSTGLGLSIVSEYMKLMGGKSYAEYNNPKLKMTLEFPIKTSVN